MPHVLVVDPERRVLIVRYHGEVAVRERQDAVRKLVQAVEKTGYHRVMIDFRDAHSRPADPAEVMRVVGDYANNVPPAARLAYLLRYDHQLDATFEDFARANGLQVERFTSMDAARAWLDATTAAPSDTSVAHALRLAADAIGDGHALRSDQVAVIGELVHVLLAAGADEATIRELAEHIAVAMAPRPG